jgi:hypothetical protein
MKRSGKFREDKKENCVKMNASRSNATFTNKAHHTLTNVVEETYTTESKWRFDGTRKSKRIAASRHRLDRLWSKAVAVVENTMAFVRRKGNAYYLVHNVRRGGKVQQLHLAKLGERARITDAVVKEVSKKHPFVDLNWREVREQLDNQINLADPQSPAVQNLVHSLRELNLDLAGMFPPVVRFSESPTVARELLVQLRLLHSTIQVKLNQFGRGADLKKLGRVEGRFRDA